jgi:hypothetical protein
MDEVRTGMGQEALFNTIVAAALFALGTIASWTQSFPHTVPQNSLMTQKMVKAFGPSDYRILRVVVDFVYDKNYVGLPTETRTRKMP